MTIPEVARLQRVLAKHKPIVPKVLKGSLRDLKADEIRYLRTNYTLPGGPKRCARWLGIPYRTLTSLVFDLRNRGVMERPR